MTWIWLKLLDLLSPLYKWQGIDYNQLRAIVGIKLEMDNRRPLAFNMRQQQKEQSYTFVWIFLLYGFFGAIFSALIAYVQSIVFSFTIYHLYLLVMIILTLISDFSSVLLDTSDNTIVLPRPISPKTFYAARTTHILLYIGQISLALSMFPIIVTFFVYGIVVGITVILTSILTIVLSVSLTNGFYLLLMRLTSEERLKTIINYFQIGMTIFIMGGYQILPRLLGLQNFKNIVNDLHWWSIFIPPMWMAGTIKLVHEFNFEWIYIVAAILTVFIPLGSWRLIDKYLAPYFTTKLADLGTSSVASSTTESKRKKSSNLLGLKWITQPGLERAAFSLIAHIISRDRKLKLRIYPSLGYSVVMLFILLFQFTGKEKGLSIAEKIALLSNTEAHLFVIYFSVFIILTIGAEINYSDEYKAAWIYSSVPIKKPGAILLGTLKAAVVKFFIPIYAITSVVVLFVWHEKAIVDLVFGLLACILLILTMAIVAEKHLPLSLPPTARTQGGSFARAIISMIFIGVISAGHYFLTKLDLLLWIACPIMLASCYYVMRLYRNMDWSEFEM